MTTSPTQRMTSAKADENSSAGGTAGVVSVEGTEAIGVAEPIELAGAVLAERAGMGASSGSSSPRWLPSSSPLESVMMLNTAVAT